MAPGRVTAYSPGMRVWVMGLVALGVSGMGSIAAAEEPAPCPPDVVREEQSFAATVARFIRFWEITQSQIAERERQSFVAATTNYERFAALTRELEARHRADEERAFDESVSLYLRKRQLTATLAREHEAR